MSDPSAMDSAPSSSEAPRVANGRSAAGLASSAVENPSADWGTERAAELYGVDAWGRSYFAINSRGHLAVQPEGPTGPSVDLKELVDEVRERGIDLPLLIRFPDILRARLREIQSAFHRAIEECSYRGSYRGVYPIKVNQNRYMVEELLEYGRPYHFGLEAGSKPELLAVTALLEDPQALIVCNGYKDQEYVETALLASRLGPRIILVVEKPAELPLIIEASERTGIRPHIGIRARLAARGAGRWEASGGDRSKFGLSAREILAAVEQLREHEMLDCFEMLHFHLGSQVSSIRHIKDALREGGWLYVNLHRMGAPLRYLDVGGGLGVDYSGTRSNQASSMNYSLQEYANDVVNGVMEVCDPSGVPHPVLITEAGRATVAHHAVLVMEVLGTRREPSAEIPDEAPTDANPVLTNLLQVSRGLERENLRETYHDALQYRDECLSLFNLGHMSLEHRVLAEEVFQVLCRRIRDLTAGQQDLPSELAALDQALADTYFCNFSLFQSIPDSWAIEQIFPVLPIHRLNEEPDRLGVIADITCDSDGTIACFASGRQRKSALELHSLRGEPYYLGAFLVGAYQEILGDLHNLFGDTNTIHATLQPAGGYRIGHVVTGDTVSDVLGYVQYEAKDLMARMRRATEGAISAGRMTRQEARHLLASYQQGLSGYTYLERE